MFLYWPCRAVNLKRSAMKAEVETSLDYFYVYGFGYHADENTNINLYPFDKS